MAVAKSAQKAKRPAKITIDCSAVVKDQIFDTAVFETFLHERVKVDNWTNNLAGNVTITRTNEKVTLESSRPFTKRYLKYLTKKFMKKNGIRDFLRVISTSGEGYKIAYIKLDSGDAADDEE